MTFREAASAVAFLTGHEDPDKAESTLDWRALAAFPGTLVVYMGVRRLPAIAQRLIDGGRDSSRAGRDRPARHVRRPARCGRDARDDRCGRRGQRIKAPAIVIFGEWPACATSSRGSSAARWPACVSWSPAPARRPARCRPACGARCDVVEAPAIRIQLLEGPAPDSARYDLVCLTSVNGVACAVHPHQRRRFGCAGAGVRSGGGDRPRHRRGADGAWRDRRRRAASDPSPRV